MLAAMASAALIDAGAAGGDPWGRPAGAPTVWRARLGPSVRRPRLVQALQDPAGPPLFALVAPAGYGKTTLLCEWDDRDSRPFAWVTLDERDDDAPSSAPTVASTARRTAPSERAAGQPSVRCSRSSTSSRSRS